MMKSMPTDIVFEIFSRLPAKSVAMCCCVSKLWASILNSRYFRELFLSRSSSRPRLIFAIQGSISYEWRFFSTPQLHYTSDKSSQSHHVVVTADSIKFLEDMKPYSCSYASGLICCRQSRSIRKATGLHLVHLICNPSTGQHVLLPELVLEICGDSTSFLGFELIKKKKKTSFLGFDPVNRQFKVMFTDCNVQRIMTLGTGELRWRCIPCSLPHIANDEGICINGILYYVGYTRQPWQQFSRRLLVCFDIGSEIFSFIEEKQVVECFDGVLFNYKGKLGGAKTSYAGETLQLHMWVLEDVEKQKRSESMYNLPENKFLRGNVSVVGMTARGDILLISDNAYLVLHLLYFNPESNTLQSVKIQGMRNFSDNNAQVFVDYVDDPRFDFVKATCLPEKEEPKQTSTSSKVDHSVKFSPINGDQSCVSFENLPKAWLINMLIGMGVGMLCSLLHTVVQP